MGRVDPGHPQRMLAYRPLHSPAPGRHDMAPETLSDDEAKKHKRMLSRDRQRRKRERDKLLASELGTATASGTEMRAQYGRQASSGFLGQQPVGRPSSVQGERGEQTRWSSASASQPLSRLGPVCTSSALLHFPIASPAHSTASSIPSANVVLSAQQHLNRGEYPTELRTPFRLEGGQGSLTKKRKRSASNGELVGQLVGASLARLEHQVAATPTRPHGRRSHSSPNTMNLATARQMSGKPARRLDLAMTPMPALGFSSAGITGSDSPLCSPVLTPGLAPSDEATLFASSLLRAFNSADNAKLRDGVLDSLNIGQADLEAMRAGIANVFDCFKQQRGEKKTNDPSAQVTLNRESGPARDGNAPETLLDAEHIPVAYAATAPVPVYGSIHPVDQYAFATPVQQPGRQRYIPHIGNFSAGAVDMPATPTPGSQLQPRPQAQPRALAFFTPNHSPTQYFNPPAITTLSAPNTPTTTQSPHWADVSHWQTPVGNVDPNPQGLMSGFCTVPRVRGELPPAQSSPCIPHSINYQA